MAVRGVSGSVGGGAGPGGVISTRQVFTVAGGGTYNRPTGCLQLRIRMVGGGGGGKGAAVNALSVNPANPGTASVFNGIAANPGAAGIDYSPVAGGTAGAGAASLRIQGSGGSGGGLLAGANPIQTQQIGATGGMTPLGGGGGSGVNSFGQNAAPNTGAGGGGGVYCDTGGGSQHSAWGGSGSAAEYVEIIINNPAASYAYTVGVGGLGGVGPAQNGGRGADGIIIVDEFY